MKITNTGQNLGFGMLIINYPDEKKSSWKKNFLGQITEKEIGIPSHFFRRGEDIEMCLESPQKEINFGELLMDALTKQFGQDHGVKIEMRHEFEPRFPEGKLDISG